MQQRALEHPRLRVFGLVAGITPCCEGFDYGSSNIWVWFNLVLEFLFKDSRKTIAHVLEGNGHMPYRPFALVFAAVERLPHLRDAPKKQAANHRGQGSENPNQIIEELAKNDADDNQPVHSERTECMLEGLAMRLRALASPDILPSCMVGKPGELKLAVRQAMADPMMVNLDDALEEVALTLLDHLVFIWKKQLKYLIHTTRVTARVRTHNKVLTF